MKDKKYGLHPRNKHAQFYDFKALTKTYPPLLKFVHQNKFNTETVDFSNPEAVLALNTALLKFFYNIKNWDLPVGYLCPPIPGRVDYIHHVADLIRPLNKDVPKGSSIKLLDIGVGANLIYPLVAHQEYGWEICGSDIDEVALKNAEKIIELNDLSSAIKLRLQTDKNKIFDNVITLNDYFHITICNPPFHSSAEEAHAGNLQKNRNLGLKKGSLNFGGKSNELWCEGGEVRFISNMIKESIIYKNNCSWFTTLVSKSNSLPILYEKLKEVNPHSIRTIDMTQGHKKSRILAWKF